MWKSSACENANGHKIKETDRKIINVQITERGAKQWHELLEGFLTPLHQRI